jgi:predicted dehydrogenase
MKPISVAIIGAGGRGTLFAELARQNPSQLMVVAVAEPNPVRRQQLAQEHHIPAERQFASWEALLAEDRLADAVIITLLDHLHFPATMAALAAGYHVLLEKPMATNPLECFTLTQCARHYNRILTICHVLRYTPFFSQIKQIITHGNLGDLVHIQHTEHVGFLHFAHSYVRGNWNQTAKAGPVLLTKSCHDIDILCWLVGANCLRVSSFGSLRHFRQEYAPVGAPEVCSNSCPKANDCLYLQPQNACVYHSRNDVADHQSVLLEFANQVTASFSLCAFSAEINRTIHVFLTHGEITGDLNKGELVVTSFRTGKTDVLQLTQQGTHQGGDWGVTRSFIDQVRSENLHGLASANTAMYTHLVTFAAEEARLTGTVVDVPTFIHAMEEQYRQSQYAQQLSVLSSHNQEG